MDTSMCVMETEVQTHLSCYRDRNGKNLTSLIKDQRAGAKTQIRERGKERH